MYEIQHKNIVRAEGISREDKCTEQESTRKDENKENRENSEKKE